MNPINPQCRLISQTFLNKEAQFVEDVCSYCGSMSVGSIRKLLETDIDIRWIETLPGNMVLGIEILNGSRFMLNHLDDNDAEEALAKSLLRQIEAKAGNLQIYYREINKYFNE